MTLIFFSLLGLLKEGVEAEEVGVAGKDGASLLVLKRHHRAGRRQEVVEQARLFGARSDIRIPDFCWTAG